MSLEALTRVWRESHAEHSDLLIMLAIADYMNEYGQAWPAIDTIAAKARLSRRTVFDRITALVAMGELEVEQGGNGSGRGHSNLYRLGSHYGGWSEAETARAGGTTAKPRKGAILAPVQKRVEDLHPIRKEPDTSPLQQKIPVLEGLGANPALEPAPSVDPAPGFVECPKCHRMVNPLTLYDRCIGSHYSRGFGPELPGGKA